MMRAQHLANTNLFIILVSLYFNNITFVRKLKAETHLAVAVVARPKRPPLCAVAKLVASVAKLVALEVQHVELLTLVAVVAFV